MKRRCPAALARTIEQRRDRLAARLLPATDGRSWLTVLREHCERRRARLEDALARTGRIPAASAAAVDAWAEIQQVGGYSTVEIAQVWGVNEGTISAGIRAKAG